MKPAHPTQKIKIGSEFIDIDVKMIPLIEGCRDQGIITLFCCQGDELDESDPWNHPQAYVVFDAKKNSPETLVKIFRAQLENSKNAAIEHYSLKHETGPKKYVRHNPFPDKFSVYFPSNKIAQFTEILFEHLQA